jgi:hypothetical protein
MKDYLIKKGFVIKTLDIDNSDVIVYVFNDFILTEDFCVAIDTNDGLFIVSKPLETIKEIENIYYLIEKQVL